MGGSAGSGSAGSGASHCSEDLGSTVEAKWGARNIKATPVAIPAGGPPLEAKGLFDTWATQRTAEGRSCRMGTGQWIICRHAVTAGADGCPAQSPGIIPCSTSDSPSAAKCFPPSWPPADAVSRTSPSQGMNVADHLEKGSQPAVDPRPDANLDFGFLGGAPWPEPGPLAIIFGREIPGTGPALVSPARPNECAT